MEEKNLINIPYWNQKTLVAPTIISRPFITKNPAKTSMKLSLLLKDIISILEDLSSFSIDAALLSRLIFRMKRVFRRDKILQGMLKINRCLSNFLGLNLLATIRELEICTYEVNGPTRESLRWALLLLLRVSAVLDAIIVRCMTTVPSLTVRLQCGQQWNIATIVLGVISRIWSISRFMCIKICCWYKQLAPFLERTFETEQDGDSNLATFKFPQDLTEWLGNPSYLLEKKYEPSTAISNIEESSKKSSELEDEEKVGASLYFNEDVGEIIPREKVGGKKKKKKPNPNKHIKFERSKELFTFIKNEKSLRKNNPTLAKTNHLNNKYWNQLYHQLTAIWMKVYRLSDNEDRTRKMLQEAEVLINKYK